MIFAKEKTFNFDKVQKKFHYFLLHLQTSNASKNTKKKQKHLAKQSIICGLTEVPDFQHLSKSKCVEHFGEGCVKPFVKYTIKLEKTLYEN